MADVRIHESWRAILDEEFDKPYFKEIKAKLLKVKDQGDVIYPPGKLIFNAFDSTPLEKVKVVILGQDPYHNPGEAMGLSFSVPIGIKTPPSLVNIFKELKSDLGIDMAANGDLTRWAGEGVLLLNAILTVSHNKPASHRTLGWEEFTNAVIAKISDHLDNCVFLLWGNFAKSKASLINNQKHLILQAAHPSPLAGGAFFGCKHFSKANEYLMSKGIKPINW
jgi:uracil-DNA glycosylase